MPDAIAEAYLSNTVVTTSGGTRVFRVGLSYRPAGVRLVAIIGHELQHVVEALDGIGADTVGSSANVLETEAARMIGARVLRECRQ